MLRFFKKQKRIESTEEFLDILKSEKTLPDLDFKNKLKMQMLKNLKVSKHAQFLNIRRVYIVPALAFSLILAFVAIQIFSGNIKNFPIINPGQHEIRRLNIAASDIQITPTAEDTLGIDPKSEFTIKTLVPVKAEDVKAAISTNVDSPFKFQAISNTEYKLSFDDALNTNKIVSLAVATVNNTGETRDLSWAFQVKAPFRILSSLPAGKATGVPLNSGIEVTFSNANFVDPSKFFEIAPYVKGRYERHGRTMVFVPSKLEEGQLYTVKVKKELGLEGSNETLSEDYTFSFETTSEVGSMYSDSFDFSRGYYEFTDQDIPLFTISKGSTPTLDVKVFSFNSSNNFAEAINTQSKIPTWAYATRTKNKYNTASLKEILHADVPIQGDESWSGYFSLPQKLPNGYYLVEASNGKIILQTWVQVSDIAGVLSTSETESFVWVIDKKTKQPLKDSVVSIVGDNTFKASNTDAEGISLFKTPQSIVESGYEVFKFFHIKASDGRQLIIPSTNTQRDYYYYYDEYYSGDYDYSGTYVDDNDNYWTYFYTDRGVYRPNDKLKFWGIIRPREAENKDNKYTVSIETYDSYNYNYEPVKIATAEVTADKLGNIIGELSFNGLNEGYQTITVRDMQGNLVMEKSFDVLPYFKPAYTISAETNKKAYFKEEEVKVSGKAAFFEGTPVSDIELQSGWQTIKTNKNGNFAYSFKAHENYSQYNSGYSSSYRNLYINTKMSELGTIFTSVPYRVFDYKTNVDLEVKESTNLKRDLTIKLNKITLDRLNNGTAKDPEDVLAETINNKEANIKITERWYEKRETGEYYDFINKINRKSYTYDEKSQVILENKVKTNNQGIAALNFDIQQNKYYEIQVSVTDLDGSVLTRETYTSGYDYGYSYEYGSGKYYRLDYALQREDYAALQLSIGDEIKAILKDAGSEVKLDNDDMVLYMTSQLGYRDIDMQKDSIYNSKFTEEDVPNIYVKAIYFDGNMFNETNNLRFNFKKEDRKLNIEVKPEKSEYAPGEEVKLDVEVKDKDGKGKKTGVNLSVVDEAIFQIDENTPRSLDDIYESVSNGIFQTYLSHYNPLIEPGGGQGDACFLAGTKILMKGGIYKNIEDVKVGDIVLTKKDESSKEFVEAKVSETINHHGTEYLLVNNHMRVTPIHVMYVNGRWMQAKHMKVGDYMLDVSGQWMPIESIQSVTGDFEVYDLNIEQYHTYFAENYYVHNKQDERSVFMDTAFFSLVNTDAGGNAKASFKAPDNITSWRITYQGITEDLHAGDGHQNINVSIPFFVDPIVEETYLKSDKPEITLRSFGDVVAESKVKGKVIYTITSKSLNIDKKVEADVLDFTNIKLENLTEGNHEIKINAKIDVYEDTIIKKFNVINSNHSILKVDKHKLSNNLKLPIPSQLGSDTNIELVLSNENRAKYYEALADLSYSYGSRLDQQLAKKFGREMFEQYFDYPNYSQTVIEPDSYQTSEGGLSLLSYGDEWLELTVKAMAAGEDSFNKAMLESYFVSILEDNKEDRYRKIVALYGLSHLDIPVLNSINKLSEEEDLSVYELVYLGLSQAELGDREKARSILEKAKPLKLENAEENSEAAGLKMMLASQIDEMAYANEMYDFIIQNPKKLDLDYLEKIVFLKKMLPYTVLGKTVEFEYTLNGKTEKITLKDLESKKFLLKPEELDKIKFNNINGNVTASVGYQSTIMNAETNKNIGISRKYFVDGKQLVPQNGQIKLKEGQIVRVELDYSVPNSDGCYEVTDYIPSGMKLSTRTATSYSQWSYENIDYPRNLGFQTIAFCAPKYENRNIAYYLRVSGKGEYTAERPKIQNLKSVEMLNWGEDVRVIIE